LPSIRAAGTGRTWRRIVGSIVSKQKGCSGGALRRAEKGGETRRGAAMDKAGLLWSLFRG